MKIYEGLEKVAPPLPRSTVAIGTFDGVHLGHRAIIRTAVEDAHTYHRPSLVFTFDRHPLERLDPSRVPTLLTTPAQRNALIEEIGAEGLVIARFDETLSELTADEFILRILKETLGAEAIVVGENFYFGKDRSGDVAFLRENQERFGYRLYALAPVELSGEKVSSTRIREALKLGEVEEAERLLGHPYWLAGTVVGGQRLGRTLGYPTANLSLTVNQTVPKDGIYAVIAKLQDGREVGGACSIGNRPTVEGAGRSIETFLFDFNEDLYGQEFSVRFVRFLRPELKFDSLDALTQQMQKDCDKARNILRAFAPAPPESETKP